MNLGSHTSAQIIKLIPDLNEQYRKAHRELDAAQKNVAAARVEVEAAERLLAEALGRFVQSFDSRVIVMAVRPDLNPDDPRVLERVLGEPVGEGRAPLRPPQLGDDPRALVNRLVDDGASVELVPGSSEVRPLARPAPHPSLGSSPVRLP